MSVQRQIDRLIAYQAAEWFEALRTGDEEHRAGFAQWIADSPRHVEAFLAIAAEAPVARKVLASGQFDLQSLLKQVPAQAIALPVLGTLPAEEESAAIHPFPPSRARMRWLAWAAAVLAILAIAIPVQLNRRAWEKFETPVGEQRTIQLAEGSVVNLNAESLVEVHFGDAQREIRLNWGEATFNVAHDASRPFRVRTPRILIEALGTQFNVYARPGSTTTVSVLEGRVKVSALKAGRENKMPEPISLTVGQEVQINPTGSVDVHKNPTVTEAIAWQQRKLIFKRTPLEDIAAEFNRYNKTTQIHLEGIEPGRFRFTGAFNADDPQSFATLLERESDLSVVRYNAGSITIRAGAGRVPDVK